MKPYAILSFVLAGAACSGEESTSGGDAGTQQSDSGQTSTGTGDGSTAGEQDTSTMSGNGMMNIPQDPSTGFFKYSGTVDGVAVARDCVSKPDAPLSDPERLAVITPGLQVNIGCQTHEVGGAYVVIKEFEDRSGDFTISVPAGGSVMSGMEFSFTKPAMDAPPRGRCPRGS